VKVVESAVRSLPVAIVRLRLVVMANVVHSRLAKAANVARLRLVVMAVHRLAIASRSLLVRADRVVPSRRAKVVVIVVHSHRVRVDPVSAVDRVVSASRVVSHHVGDRAMVLAVVALQRAALNNNPNSQTAKAASVAFAVSNAAFWQSTTAQ
jgi:hypothetical protein